MLSPLLEGKKGLIIGLSNDRGIAYGIAKACKEQGAELCFSYQEIMEKRVKPLAEQLDTDFLVPCEITDEEELENLFKEIDKRWGKLDFMVHAVAYSDKNELRGRFSNTTKENFQNTLLVSSYSLISATKFAKPLMEKAGGGSIIAMTYLGGERVIPHYNVMGVAKAALESIVKYLAVDLGSDNIRVNAVSSGPMKTLAAAGIGGFNYMLKFSELNTPLKRNVTLEENGNTAVYLLSDMSSGVTGEVIHLDGGYHVTGMKDPKTPNIDIPEGVQ